MAWKYCQHCGGENSNGFDLPNPDEAFGYDRAQTCNCGASTQVTEEERDMLILGLFERVEALEATIAAAKCES